MSCIGIVLSLFIITPSSVSSLDRNIRQTVSVEDRLRKLEQRIELFQSSLSQCSCVKPLCPSEWKQFNDTCWRIFHQQLNWTSAQNVCHSFGSELASIHSEDENNFAHGLWQQMENKTDVMSVGANFTADDNNETVCFKHIPHQMLVGFADKIENPVTLEQCKDLCTATNCSSFLFYPESHICVTSAHSMGSNPELIKNFVNFDKVDYYEVTPCAIGAPPSNCQRTYADIMLLIDGSGSIGEDEFPKIKNFLKLLVNSTTVGRTKSQFGMVQFSDEQWTEFSLNQHLTNEAVNNAIDRVPYRQGGTLIGEAIQYTVAKELLPPFRGRRKAFPDYLVILTDGYSQDDPTQQAQRLRSLGVTIIAIGVTANVSKEQLINIAGSDDRVFLVEDFDSLGKELSSLVNSQLCTENGMWIGLTDQRIEKIYQWADNSQPTYFKWADQQPDDKQHMENCVSMTDKSAEWNDMKCTSTKSFVCKKTF